MFNRHGNGVRAHAVAVGVKQQKEHQQVILPRLSIYDTSGLGGIGAAAPFVNAASSSCSRASVVQLSTF